MLVAIVNDSHWGCRGDSSVFAKHFENFYSDTFFPYLDKHGIKTVLDLGDTFDKRKEINFKTLTHSRKVYFDEIQKRGIDLHIIAGNHTVYYKNTNDLSILDMLSDLYPNVTVYKEPKDILIDKKPFLMLPWINSSNYDESVRAINNTPASCVLSHLELLGFNLQAGNVATHGMNKALFDKFPLVLSGHYHSKSDDGRIYYLGTQYDITWSDYGEKKYFHVLDTDTLELTAIENTDKIFIKLTYNDSEKGYAKVVEAENFSRLKNKIVKIIVTSKANAVLFDKFLEKITEAQPSDISIIDDTQRLLYAQNNDNILISDTLEIVKQTITDIPLDLDKDRLYNFIAELYHTAQEE